MATWQVGLVIMIAVGVAVILFGALWDRERAKRDADRLSRPPDRPIPGYAGTSPPAYVTDAQPKDAPSLALTDTRRMELAAQLAATPPIAAGMATPEFVSDSLSGWAVLDDPAVLVCAEPVATMHELLQPLGRLITTGRGIVIVTPSLAAEVQATLVMNHNHRTGRLLAVVAASASLSDAAYQCGATPLTHADLQAGWIPADALGSAHTWVSDLTHSWIIPAETSATG